MSHPHRTYEETYGEKGKTATGAEEKQTVSKDEPVNPKFGDHTQNRQAHERKTEGTSINVNFFSFTLTLILPI
jgi:hypothetical protein